MICVFLGLRWVVGWLSRRILGCVGNSCVR